MAKPSSRVFLFSLFAILFIALLAYLASDQLDQERTINNNPASKTIISTYLVGSNLEDDTFPVDDVPDNTRFITGYATGDLEEMVEGIKNQDVSDEVDVFVAFGGARTEGWIGIKYADEECLLKDAENGRFGDSDCYSFVDESANMAEPSVYTAFLNEVKDVAEPYNRSILVNWNHGGDYLGYGNDSNFPGDSLTLTEMEASYKLSESDFDMIGFDACLMGSIEVANSVQNYADYLIASEELEPGHGWQYEDIIAVAADKNGADITEVGKGWVDSYIDSEDHKNTTGKTLSVVELSKLEAVKTELDKVISETNGLEGLESYQRFVYGVKDSKAYGSSFDESDSYSIDLVGLLNSIEDEGNTGVKTLRDNVGDYVVYTRDDGKEGESYGVSLFNPQNFSFWLAKFYNKEVAATPIWYSSLNTYFEEIQKDSTMPVINDPTDCTEDDVNGHCVSIQDNTALKTAGFASSYQYTDNLHWIYYSEWLDSVGSDKYFTDTAGRSVVGICSDKQCSQKLPFGVSQVSELEDNQIQYSSRAEVNGRDAIIYLIADGSLQSGEDIKKVWYVPMLTGDGETNIPSKEQLEFSRGDKITPYFMVLDVGSNKTYYKSLEKEIVLGFGYKWYTEQPTVDASELNMFVYGVDLRGNMSVKEVSRK